MGADEILEPSWTRRICVLSAGARHLPLLEIDLMKMDDGGSGVLSYFEAHREEMLASPVRR